MENIYLLLFVGLIFWYFIYLRKVSEFARLHINTYFKKEGLQFITIARRSSRLKFDSSYGLYWHSIFDVEFSGDGEASYQGEVSLRGYKLVAIDLPVYRIN